MNMKHVILLFLTIMATASCREESQEQDLPALNQDQMEEVAYLNYGATIGQENSLNSQELENIYEKMDVGDSVKVKVKTMVQDVCTNKGCWIQIPVSNDQSARVTFKDYGFFLPMNSQSKEVILSGVAYKGITTRDDAQHYASDGGKSPEEIAAILKDEVTLNFIADGALVEYFEDPDLFVPSPKQAD